METCSEHRPPAQGKDAGIRAPVPRERSLMCNLYSMATNQAAMPGLFRKLNRYVSNLAPMPDVFPNANWSPFKYNCCVLRCRRKPYGGIETGEAIRATGFETFITHRGDGRPSQSAAPLRMIGRSFASRLKCSLSTSILAGDGFR
jgi:hypothetical protein